MDILSPAVARRLTLFGLFPNVGKKSKSYNISFCVLTDKNIDNIHNINEDITECYYFDKDDEQYTLLCGDITTVDISSKINILNIMQKFLEQLNLFLSTISNASFEDFKIFTSMTINDTNKNPIVFYEYSNGIITCSRPYTPNKQIYEDGVFVLGNPYFKEYQNYIKDSSIIYGNKEYLLSKFKSYLLY